MFARDAALVFVHVWRSLFNRNQSVTRGRRVPLGATLLTEQLLKQENHKPSE